MANKIKITDMVERVDDPSTVQPTEQMFVDYSTGEIYKAVMGTPGKRTAVNSQEFNEFFYS